MVLALTGHVFTADKIHPIARRGDQTDVRARVRRDRFGLDTLLYTEWIGAFVAEPKSVSPYSYTGVSKEPYLQ